MVPTRGEKCGIKHMQKEKKTVSNLQQSGYKQKKDSNLNGATQDFMWLIRTHIQEESDNKSK